MTAPLIEISDLHYRYEDGTQALSGVNFTLHEGETVILLGANGSGKTTFLLHLNGLLKGEGKVNICGLPMNQQNRQEIRRRVGIVFQDADEQLFMPTVLEDVAFAPLNQGVQPHIAMSRAEEILHKVGLNHHSSRAPYHLSSGEKRRAAIAGILAMDPSVLVLDEPTTYLDPPGQRILIQLLSQLHQAKIIATHDLVLARKLGNRGIFFEQGKIVGDGPVSELITRFNWSIEE